MNVNVAVLAHLVVVVPRLPDAVRVTTPLARKKDATATATATMIVMVEETVIALAAPTTGRFSLVANTYHILIVVVIVTATARRTVTIVTDVTVLAAEMTAKVRAITPNTIP